MMDEPPPLLRCAVLTVILLLLLPATVGADPGVPAFYYGDGSDGYLGRYHAAWWHGYRGFSPRVNLTSLGIATANWSIPFNTRLCIEIVAVPEWAEEEFSHLIGRRATGVVVDRMAAWVIDEIGPALDLWPALFRRLAGPEWRRIGRLGVEYEICNQYIERR